MTVEYADAISEMQKLFKAAWLANSGAIFGYVPDIEWQGLESIGKADRSKAWGKFSTQNVDEGQASLSTHVGAPFQKKYSGAGLVFFQLFLPKSVDNAIPLGRKLAQVARDAFRGKKTAGGVTFQNVRINGPLPPEALFYRYNVVAEYEYNELG